MNKSSKSKKLFPAIPKTYDELQALKAARAKERLYFWVKKYWKIKDNQELDFEKYAYLRPIYQSIHKYGKYDVTFKKAAQLGLSEFMMALGVWAADTMSKNVGYYFPSATQLSDFVTMRIDPTIENSEYLQAITARGGLVGKKKAADNKGLKRIRNAFMLFRGAQSPNQITSTPLDIAILDERDRFDAQAVPMIEKRLNNSDIAWRFNASTPTFPGSGVDEEMQDTTCNQWHVICPTCKKHQVLEYFKNVDEDKGLIVCSQSKCSHIFRQEEIQGGYWKAKNPRAKREGYEMSGLLSPTLYNDNMKRLRSVIKAMNSNNLLIVQEAHNQDLGITYRAGDASITDAMLDACNRDYTLPFDLSRKKKVYAGLDIGKISYLVIMQDDQKTGKPMIIGCVELRDVEIELPQYMDQYDILSLVVDAMPEQNLVANLLIKYPGRVFACNYDYTKLEFSSVDSTFYKWYDNRVSAHRTGSLDEFFGMIRAQDILFPRHAKYIPGLYEQLQNQTRTISTIRGVEMYVYQDNGKPDHYAHAGNYAIMARQRLPGDIDDSIGTRSKSERSQISEGERSSYYDGYDDYDDEDDDPAFELVSKKNQGFNKKVFP